MESKDINKILSFTHEMNKVKNLLRFKGMPQWEGKNINRWDSIAEHSYRMALLAVMLVPYLTEKVNLERVLKMILVHDIVDVLEPNHNPHISHGKAGGHAFNEDAFQQKYNREVVAAESVFSSLPNDLAEEFLVLFKEYINTKAFKETSTAEGRLAYALDKIEAIIQIIDWKRESKNWEQNESEKESFEKSMEYMHVWSDYEPNLKYLASLVEEEARKLVV